MAFLRQLRRDWIYLEKLLSLVRINFCWPTLSVLILSVVEKKISTLMLSKHKSHLRSVNIQLWQEQLDEVFFKYYLQIRLQKNDLKKHFLQWI